MRNDELFFGFEDWLQQCGRKKIYTAPVSCYGVSYNGGDLTIQVMRLFAYMMLLWIRKMRDTGKQRTSKKGNEVVLYNDVGERHQFTRKYLSFLGDALEIDWSDISRSKSRKRAKGRWTLAMLETWYVTLLVLTNGDGYRSNVIFSRKGMLAGGPEAENPVVPVRPVRGPIPYRVVFGTMLDMMIELDDVIVEFCQSPEEFRLLKRRLFGMMLRQLEREYADYLKSRAQK